MRGSHPPHMNINGSRILVSLLPVITLYDPEGFQNQDRGIFYLAKILGDNYLGSVEHETINLSSGILIA